MKTKPSTAPALSIKSSSSHQSRKTITITPAHLTAQNQNQKSPTPMNFLKNKKNSWSPHHSSRTKLISLSQSVALTKVIPKEKVDTRKLQNHDPL